MSESLTGNAEMDDVVLMAEKSIEEGVTASFVYDGMTRIVEIHAVGLSTKGKPCLRAYQTEGDSLSGAPNWKLFSVNKIHNFKMLPEVKASLPREGYQRGDKGMSFIFKEV